MTKSQKIHIFDLEIPLTTWGKCTLLLQLLYRQNLLPECHIYEMEHGDEYFIRGNAVGKTEEEITTNIWLMVERWERCGNMFN